MCTHACNRCNISLYKGNIWQSRNKSIVYMTCRWQVQKTDQKLSCISMTRRFYQNINSDSWGLRCTGNSTFSTNPQKNLYFWSTSKRWVSGSVSVIHKVWPTKLTSSASPGNLLEMQILEPNSRLLNQKLQGSLSMDLNSRIHLYLDFLFNSNRSSGSAVGGTGGYQGANYMFYAYFQLPAASVSLLPALLKGQLHSEL